MTLVYEYDLILKNTCIPKMNFVGQGFQKSEYYTVTPLWWVGIPKYRTDIGYFQIPTPTHHYYTRARTRTDIDGCDRMHYQAAFANGEILLVILVIFCPSLESALCCRCIRQTSKDDWFYEEAISKCASPS